MPLPPGTRQFRVVLYSAPVELAAGGAAAGVEVTIPAATPPGTHTLVVWALVGDDVQVSGAELRIARPGALPATGGSPWDLSHLALVVIVTGAVVTITTRRRRIDGGIS